MKEKGVERAREEGTPARRRCDAPGAAAGGGGTRARRQEPETMPASASVSKGESDSRRSAASISAGVGALPAFVTAKSSTWSAATPQCEYLVHARSASRATESLLNASSSAKGPLASAEPITRAMKMTNCVRGGGRGSRGCVAT